MTKAPAAKKPKVKVTKVSTSKVTTDPAQSQKTNVIDDPAQSLQVFDLLDLQKYTQEKTYSNTASKDFHLFYVGRDDVHEPQARSVEGQCLTLSQHVRVR
jgi:hypothetical protein